ncbi:MAG: alcohol dehydrogenase [Chloroflexi bacterium]|nr:alcohol dehydrogenase [Chloroflexota bacterium]
MLIYVQHFSIERWRSRVKAAVLFESNKPMPIVELDQSEPKTGEVRVKMSAAGVCASDHHVMTGDNPTPMPIVLGHEGAGVVDTVGPGVTMVKQGDRCVLSFVPSCGHCRSCRTGIPNICDTNRETGTRQYDGTCRLYTSDGTEVHQFAKLGVFAESVVIPQQACYPMPNDVPMEVAALIGCSVTTGVGGVINQPNMRAGMTVAVIGAGGVGLNAIQGAALMNASRVIAVDIHDHKLEFAYKFGATDVINANDQDAVAAIQEMTGDGVDFAFDTFGHKLTTEQAYKATRKGGTTVIVGLAPDGMNAEIPLVELVRNQKTLVGSYYGSASPHETFRKLLSFYKQGRIDVGGMVTRRYKLDEINMAYEALERAEDGRGVIIFD